MQRNLKNISDTTPFSCNFETTSYMQGAAFTGNCTYSIPTSLDLVNPNVRDQFSQLEFQPCSKCPQNLIILDHTDLKHQVMYNPDFVQKLSFENVNLKLPNLEVEDLSRLHGSPSFKEDTNEIDILLSSDEGENIDDDDDDDDTVSTGRTPYNRYSASCNSSSCDSTCGGPDWNDCSRERMQKMVCILREIVPGMEGLDAGTVLDEAVKYLKYLKAEVEKLGISNFDY